MAGNGERKKNEGALKRAICSGAGNGIVFPEDIYRNLDVVERSVLVSVPSSLVFLTVEKKM